jgi:hypothetical protein
VIQPSAHKATIISQITQAQMSHNPHPWRGIIANRSATKQKQAQKLEA